MFGFWATPGFLTTLSPREGTGLRTNWADGSRCYPTPACDPAVPVILWRRKSLRGAHALLLLLDCFLSCLFTLTACRVATPRWLILSTPFLLLGSVPEQIKPSVSQPQPANSPNGSSAATSTTNNAKRATGSSNPQQPPPPQPQPQPQPPAQAVPRYPREVPPRFRHQEHKQLLKRGQHFPVIAANLGSAVKVQGSQPESSALSAPRPQDHGEAPGGRTPSGEGRFSGDAPLPPGGIGPRAQRGLMRWLRVQDAVRREQGLSHLLGSH